MDSLGVNIVESNNHTPLEEQSEGDYLDTFHHNGDLHPEEKKGKVSESSRNECKNSHNHVERNDYTNHGITNHEYKEINEYQSYNNREYISGCSNKSSEYSIHQTNPVRHRPPTG
jgi:hypothetical protein